MPPKKQTRNVGSFLGPPKPLPDTGGLSSFKDVLSAVKHELIVNPKKTQRDCCISIEKEVRGKFLKADPQLPSFSEYSAVWKIERQLEISAQFDRNILAGKKKQNFLKSVNKICDLIICQCQITPCQENHDCSGIFNSIFPTKNI